jgi:biopolymer transport protein ExbD
MDLISIHQFQRYRDVIITKKRSTPPEDLVVVIKPNEEATYNNTVDILDEMTTMGIKTFCVGRYHSSENEPLKATEASKE